MIPTTALFAQAGQPKFKTREEQQAFERGQDTAKGIDAAGRLCGCSCALLVMVGIVLAGLWAFGVFGTKKKPRRRPRDDYDDEDDDRPRRRPRRDED